MAVVRAPLVAGVAGGVGASTIAVALFLRPEDGTRYIPGQPVDVLVARATVYSLGLVQQALDTLPGPAVLALVGEQPGEPSRQVQTRLGMTDRTNLAAVVHVPYVPGWANIVDPHAAARALVTTESKLRGAERAFVTAIATLTDAVHPLVAPALAEAAHPDTAQLLPDTRTVGAATAAVARAGPMSPRSPVAARSALAEQILPVQVPRSLPKFPLSRRR
ncbi:hypothetical protein [Pseudonocardia thermophila]|jgi:hypothetical protein|uniref:hypothetical protein n=1 Tax=Pseudonocardia thermophila TaxID=1848 RepID=UPI00248EA1C1|nr:hypothetical protein [Pseudonocardia thermophila]